jgi:hypothetical protein
LKHGCRGIPGSGRRDISRTRSSCTAWVTGDPDAGWLRRVAAELHERGGDRRYRWAGQDAQQYHVSLPEPSHIRRGAGQCGAAPTAFRASEVHGPITQRGRDPPAWLAMLTAKVTRNLWANSWSKFAQQCHGDGFSTCAA